MGAQKDRQVLPHCMIIHSSSSSNSSSGGYQRNPTILPRAMQHQDGCSGTGTNQPKLRNMVPPREPGLPRAALGQSCTKAYPRLRCPLSTWDCHRVAMGSFGGYFVQFCLPEWLLRKKNSLKMKRELLHRRVP